MRKLRRGSRAKRAFLQKMRTLFLLGALPSLRQDRLFQRIRERLPFLRICRKGWWRSRSVRHGRTRSCAEFGRNKKPLFLSQKAFFFECHAFKNFRRRKPPPLDLCGYGLRPAWNHSGACEMRLDLIEKSMSPMRQNWQSVSA